MKNTCMTGKVLEVMLEFQSDPRFEVAEDGAVEHLLFGVPLQGGTVSREYLEAMCRAAFRGGIVAVSDLKGPGKVE